MFGKIRRWKFRRKVKKNEEEITAWAKWLVDGGEPGNEPYLDPELREAVELVVLPMLADEIVDEFLAATGDLEGHGDD